MLQFCNEHNLLSFLFLLQIQYFHWVKINTVVKNFQKGKWVKTRNFFWYNCRNHVHKFTRPRGCATFLVRFVQFMLLGKIMSCFIVRVKNLLVLFCFGCNDFAHECWSFWGCASDWVCGVCVELHYGIVLRVEGFYYWLLSSLNLFPKTVP